MVNGENKIAVIEDLEEEDEKDDYWEYSLLFSKGTFYGCYL
jgi:hypothetical protein